MHSLLVAELVSMAFCFLVISMQLRRVGAIDRAYNKLRRQV
jgi:hypothetical protein